MFVKARLINSDLTLQPQIMPGDKVSSESHCWVISAWMSIIGIDSGYGLTYGGQSSNPKVQFIITNFSMMLSVKQINECRISTTTTKTD